MDETVVQQRRIVRFGQLLPAYFHKDVTALDTGIRCRAVGIDQGDVTGQGNGDHGVAVAAKIVEPGADYDEMVEKDDLGLYLK